MPTNIKELRHRIKAVENTQKVTRSMKLISTVKLKQLSRHLHNLRFYLEEIKKVLLDITACEEYKSSKHAKLFSENDTPKHPKKVIVIAVGADRGLCGNYNSLICKYLAGRSYEYTKAGSDVKLILVGKKLKKFAQFNMNHEQIDKSFTNEEFETEIPGISKLIKQEFQADSCQRVELLFGQMLSSTSWQVNLMNLLPILPQELKNFRSKKEAKDTGKSSAQDKNLILFEPSLSELLNEVALLYLDTTLKFALTESRTSEMASRMVAMTQATDNAGKLMDNLKLVMNKSRQASITQEISEIVIGVESIKD